MRHDLPTGTVTFVFTDIEGSTRLLEELGAVAYGELLSRHHAVCRAAWSQHGGVEVDTAGDAFFVAFPTASAALGAAADAQGAIAELGLRVRMGVHTGEVTVAETGYVGFEVHRAARIASAAHGGQVVVSASTAALVSTDGLVDLGEHRFKDLAAAQRIYQLGEGEHPPLKSLFRSNLPVPATPFLGREPELAEVAGLLRNETVRLVTLTGPGGTGKTRLALQAAAEASDGFPDGVFWVPLASLDDPGLVASAVAHGLDVKEQPGRDLVDVLCERLEGRRLLLLLDNGEHLLPQLAATVSRFGSVAGPTILVTSRERMQLGGERTYAVPELAGAEAVDLFHARAADAWVPLERSAAVEELCVRLEQLPLALELAAARTVVFAPEQLLARLAQRLDLLKGGRDADPRQRTLRATIEWSYELLDEPERRLFRALSVFAGGCTYDAAEQAADADPDTLQSLLDKSLLRRRDTEHGPRYWMLETIREYATELLVLSDEESSLRAQHAAWLLELVRELGTGLRRMTPDAVARIAPERDNVARAIASSLDGGAPSVAHELVGRLCVYWFFTGVSSEGLVHADHLQRLEPVEPNAAYFSCLVGLSELYGHTGDPRRGIDLKERALTMLDELGDEPIPAASAEFTKAGAAAMILKDLAQLHAGQGEFARAQACADESIARARALGTDRLVAHALFAKGIVEFRSDRYAEARELFAESLPSWLGHSAVDEAGTRLMIGECLRREGRHADASEQLRTGLELSRQVGDISALHEAVQEFAALAVVLGRPEVGAALIGSSERLRTETDMPMWDPADYERTVTALRDQLGDVEFESLREAGAALSDDEAFALALTID